MYKRPHIRVVKNQIRNEETGRLTEYYQNVLVGVKYKSLLYSKFSSQDLRNVLIIIDDHVRERHEP
jgi:hypothetical protein